MNPEEREELARLLPSPGDPVLTSDRHHLLEEHLMRELAQDTQYIPTPPEPRSSAPRLRRRFAMIAIPLVTAAAVAATVVVGTGGSETPATDQEAVSLFNRIATVAAEKKSVPVRNDQYVYIRTHGTRQVMDKGSDTFRRSDWLAVDGKRAGLARITVLSGPSGKGTEDTTLGADSNMTTYRELAALPTDADQLYKKIWADTEGQGPTHEAAALEMIGSMLEEATLVPEVDAALYRAAAKIPGVTVVENAKDVAGRPGIGLSFDDGKDSDVWVFDKKTLHYLGSDEVALLGAGIVDKIGDWPSS